MTLFASVSFDVASYTYLYYLIYLSDFCKPFALHGMSKAEKNRKLCAADTMLPTSAMRQKRVSVWKT